MYLTSFIFNLKLIDCHLKIIEVLCATFYATFYFSAKSLTTALATHISTKPLTTTNLYTFPTVRKFLIVFNRESRVSLKSITCSSATTRNGKTKIRFPRRLVESSDLKKN